MNKTIEKNITRRRATTRTRNERPPMAFVTPDSKEWHAAREAMAAFTGDHAFTARDPESLEVWQYLGSGLRSEHWEHEFLHRWHPICQRRLVIAVPASARWRPPRRSIH